MSGKKFIVLFLIAVLIFSVSLFYFQNYAYYESVDHKHSIFFGDKRYKILSYQGIDSKSSGLKLRECLVIEGVNLIDLPKYEKPTPLKAPFWFSCFDAESIARDLEYGEAVSFLLKKEEFDGIDSVVAVYTDGRVYRWRQLNNKYLKE